jgi:hypothetical protein
VARSVQRDPGSFRDPLSRVFLADDSVYRGLTAAGLADYEAVAAAPFFSRLLEERLVVPTTRLPTTSPLDGEWAAVLQHERVKVVSYPYEWSFAMLRDAALLQLDVTRRALGDGFTTKDATPYNVQFEDLRPVFIDVGSFEPRPADEPWLGYQQFCELFLNPLVLQAVGNMAFQPWLRGSLDGIRAAEVEPLVRGRKRLDRGLLVHVVLHARAERRYADRDRDVRGELRQAGLGPKVIASQLDNLARTVASLRWSEQSSTWSDYAGRSHYTQSDLAAKEAFVESAVEARRPSLVLDLGANDGHFSKVALRSGAQRVVAVDSDHLTVDRLYRSLREVGEARILPLVMDVANPSPGLGWAGRERGPFTRRVAPELVLCLAVVHHLALTDTVPFELVVDFLADFGADVVVEFPHPDDPMVARLLARKRAGLFDHYQVADWERALESRFAIVRREVLPSGRRTMYACTRR